MDKIKGKKLWIQEGPGCLHLVWHVGVCATRILKERNELYIDFILALIKDNMFTWAYDEKSMIKIGDQMVENENKDPDYTKKLIKIWESDAKEYYKLCKKLDNTNLSELTDAKLSEHYTEFINSYQKEYSIAMLTDMIGYYSEINLDKHLKQDLEKLGKTKEYNQIAPILIQPIEPGFLEEEKFELLQIAKDYIEGKEISTKEHSEKWFWMQNNYWRTVRLDEKYFLERIKNHSKNPEGCLKELEDYHNKFERAKKEKQDIIKELNLSKETQQIVNLIEVYSQWQDKRKMANLIGHHHIMEFLKEVVERKNISFEDMKFTTPEEVTEILETGKLNLEEIKKRREITGVIFTPEKITHYNYQESLELDKEVKQHTDISNISDLFGTVANTGLKRGLVKNIKGPEEFSKMNDGDILVTSMTRPEFMPILKKAGAIVTDEGGLTCHAAIVARELGVPCIVSTKVASKLLQDGMEVEVNANHGVVKILRSKK